MNENTTLLLTLGTLAGSAITYILNSLYKIFNDCSKRSHEIKLQNSDHEQKRIEFHVDFLREKLEKIEEQITSVTKSNLAVMGHMIASNAYTEEQGSDRNDILAKELSRIAETEYVISEINYLKTICEHYEIKGSLLHKIDTCYQKLNEANKDGQSESADFDSFENSKAIASTLIEIRVLLRLALHLLVDKILKSED